MIKGIEIIDLGIMLKNEKILVLSDFHIGYEEALNKQGILVPKFQFKDIIKRLTKILQQLREENMLLVYQKKAWKEAILILL